MAPEQGGKQTANTKERLENLETCLGLVQDQIHKMNTGITDKFWSLEYSFNKTLEESMNRVREMMASSRESGTSASRGSDCTEEQQLIEPRVGNPLALVNHGLPRQVKLVFPCFHGGDLTEWMSKAKQYVTYQGMPREQRVGFASYHFTEEANEWWQSLTKARGIEPHQILWGAFKTKLWTRFGPMDGENFDEALSHIRQKEPLIEYQREFERLQNKVEGLTEKALAGTYMGGLNSSIYSGIRMFKPKTLTETINLARMRDDQLQQEKRWQNTRRYNPVTPQSGENSRPAPFIAPVTGPKPAAAPRKLTWDELKRKRSLGLCFSCDQRYSPGHKCKQPQLFLMESEQDE